jgi:regulator of sirC expression with transglutaminase-like and TPR domain
MNNCGDMILSSIENPKSKMTNGSQLEAIFSLLDDPDPFVQQSIRAHLLEHGSETVPVLRQMIRTVGNEEIRKNAAGILKGMGVQRFRTAIRELLSSPQPGRDIDLEMGAFAVALLCYPELRIADYLQQLDQMASLLEQRLRGCVDGVMIVHEMNSYLVDALGFRGCDQDHYYDPDNSCINRVLDRRIGIPVTLSVVYLLLARRLEIPLKGTNFPTRFLMKYQTDAEEFFVDAFDSGAILDHGDCRRFLRGLGIDYHPAYLESVSNRLIVARIMRNLAEIYRKSEPDLTAELEQGIAAVAG